MSDEIWLEGMTFKAYHGVHTEERKSGNLFEVDLGVTTDVQKASESDALKDTVNYEQLYTIVATEMKEPAHLLEHVAGRIAKKILLEFPSVQTVTMNLSKLHPPLGGGPCRKACVRISRSRSAARKKS